MNKTPTSLTTTELEIPVADLSRADVPAADMPSADIPEQRPDAPSELLIGRIVGGVAQAPLVLFEFNGSHHCLEALVTAELQLPRDLGREVCLSFLKNSLSQPIVLGLLHRSEDSTRELKLSSSMGISLTCGKATILLRPDGTVAIRGVNIASRASHTNRIRGGNVQIN